MSSVSGSFFLIDRLRNLWYNQYVSGNSTHSPISYRGYYYDKEYGFYCLGTRFYDPVTRRFISPDDVDFLGANRDLNSYNLYAYCSNNAVMYTDPSGHFIIAAIVVGLAIGFGATLYSDYEDDGEIFNGSVDAEDYIVNTAVGGLAGAAIGYIAPALGGAAASSYAIAGGEVVAAFSGAVVAGAATTVGIVLFSKHNPGMSNKPPYSWTTNSEGKDFMVKNKMNANKAADDLMNSHFDNWHRGAGTPHNAIKKWLDRVVRKMISGG